IVFEKTTRLDAGTAGVPACPCEIRLVLATWAGGDARVEIRVVLATLAGGDACGPSTMSLRPARGSLTTRRSDCFLTPTRPTDNPSKVGIFINKFNEITSSTRWHNLRFYQSRSNYEHAFCAAVLKAAPIPRLKDICLTTGETMRRPQ